MNIYLGGANASGKSTIMAEYLKLDPSAEIIHGTRLLMDAHGIAGDYDELRRMSQEHLRPVYSTAMRRLLSEPVEHTRILDSHYLYIRKGEVHQSTEDWIGDFDAVVLVYADPETSWKRIRADHKKRDRALFPEGLSDPEAKTMYADYIERTIAEFERIAAYHRLPNLFLDNSHNSPYDSAQVLHEFISEQSR
jgi:adenylate kinase